MTVLILGGTREARTLAILLVGQGVRVISSLAGRVTTPALPAGEVRIGGFGGVEGLVAYEREHAITAVVDATHPFASRISANAAAAHHETGIPLLRLQRPGWETRPDADGWHWVDTTAEAVAVAGRLGTRVFVTTGRKSLRAYAAWTDRYVLVRLVDQADWWVPTNWEVLVERGPYDPESETALMRDRRIDVLTTKNSGGSLTEAKLQAAADLGVPVVIVRRPAAPEGIEQVGTPEEAAAWVLTRD
ncbi:cobalt-precorrin-6A reductase [Raineyella sp.]|uniref:cobalt-precorrin-6A reductase n=1 Tax=Raineyella sp. TaxID=1911550 RepID=UPI002B1EF7BA|nr:cobalt-precorrin-6A reductase [Raineyella sp.]MEA5154949.1 cobalt-precorrin-6A reductase [Raineyella sp.]